jgi:pyridoxamine 5'-phosphate oxidase
MLRATPGHPACDATRRMTADPRARPLSRRDLDPDPLRQFERWFTEARSAGLPFPEAAALATATPDGRPSLRMVLVKSFDERGFCFFSGYESRKGRELEVNPRAALCFYWHDLGRQARVEGEVGRVSAEESDAYFLTRPRSARLSAAASRQGEAVASRQELEARVAELAARYPGDDLPRPAFWGGYVLEPVEYELWQHREDRLHDRFRYRRAGAGWDVQRLAP